MYDVAIIGTGIGGSTLAAVLARQGVHVIVFEGGAHPRFTVGESMILETTEIMRALAEYYDVPELAYFSLENYYDFIGTSHGVKRHFSFLHHTPRQRQNPRQSLQAVIPRLPCGHEIHIYRQDSDYLLTSIAISYGARVLQQTPVRDVNVTPDGVEVITDKETYHANYIVDAGGMKRSWPKNMAGDTATCRRIPAPSTRTWWMCPATTTSARRAPSMASLSACQKERCTTSSAAAGSG